jgi:thioredoxin 1
MDLAKHDAELVNADIAEQPELIEKYGLSGVPVLLFFRNGVEVTRLIGLRPTEEIIDAIEYAKVVR